MSGPYDIEQRIQETEQRFQIMADCAPVLLWMSRTDSMCTFFNQTWLDFTGRTQEEEWGIGWAEGIHFEDFQRCMDTYIAAFNQRQSFGMEYRLRRADGEYRWILDRGTPRYTPDGTFAGYIGSCIDITDQKKLEFELRRALGAKDDFIGMVSHELRTPITALQLQLEIFRREKRSTPLTPKQEDILRRMGISTVRLADLVESILQFSRIERGRLQVQGTKFDLETVVQAVLEEVRPVAEKKSLELRITPTPRLPSLVSDPELVRLIISNLVSNAIKYTDEGYVEVVLSPYHDSHRISVKDTGRGIPREEHERIFQPFEQLESSRQKHMAGVGLGLALVRAMTSALGGQIGLESEVGRGTVFTVVLPSIDEQPTEL